MYAWDTVAIVGVGLIGGSIGLALEQRKLARQVVGIGARAASLRQAKRLAAVTRTTTDLARGVRQADLVVVCTPVGMIASLVREAAAACHAGAVITDAGSTKAEIVAELDGGLPGGAAFVGSHPLAGSEKRGAAAASADLFEGRVVVVTPTARTSAAACETVERLWTALGARVVRMTPRDHDEAVAATSHLPHVAASALALVTPREHLPLVAGGWMDTTRVAAGDAALWRQILSTNRTHVARALARYEKALASFRKAIQQGDEAQLEHFLSEAKQIRDAVGS